MEWMGERVKPQLSGEKTAVVEAVLETFDFDASRLVDMLLEIQRQIPGQHLPKEVASFVSWRLDIPLSRTFDVISFYSALSDTPRGEVVVQFCDSVVCRMTGHHGIEGRLAALLGVVPGEISADGRVYVEAVPCFGACDIAPALRINGKVYGHLDTEVALMSALRTSGALAQGSPVAVEEV